jgi:pyruvate dehydrogenase E2 component (dihydrolipoamide acetyltransferase)
VSAGSAQVFTLPDLGEGLTEAEIVRWLVAVGDEVRIDQAIVEVETAKSLVEVPSPFAGSVAILHGAEGETLEVGSPLITVGAAEAAGESAEAATEAYRVEERAGSGNVLIGYGTPEGGGGGRRRRRRARPSIGSVASSALAVPAPESSRAVPRVTSPLVRILARDLAVDLRHVEPTGSGDVITRADVVKAGDGASALLPLQTAVAPAPATGPALVDGERRVPLTGFRKAVSATLSRSRTEIPEATVWVDVDATALWELRESARTAQDAGPGVMAYLARFVVAALREHPVLNARLDTERQEIVQLPSIDLGIAVQSQRGLVVPAVMAAETLTTSGLDAEIRAVTQRAREGRSRPDELMAGTFTLNNYGSFRVDGSAAIINHPQVAILGFGRIIDRPWVVNGEILPRKITQMSFVFDHRVCDGGTAAGFMRSVADAVENPAAAIARL